ncbi:MAG: hypothetical protein H6621_04985 [Halobacteriovoraceae bacterium]|nr:hypothetical protein [Halobacteriovoraceae bacterium]
MKKDKCKKSVRNSIFVSAICSMIVFTSSCSKDKSSAPTKDSSTTSKENYEEKLSYSLQSSAMIATCVLNQKKNEIECQKPKKIWSNQKQEEETAYPFGVYNPKYEEVEWKYGRYEWSNSKQTEEVVNVFGVYNPNYEKVEWKYGRYEWSNSKQTEEVVNVFGFYNPKYEKVEWETIEN